MLTHSTIQDRHVRGVLSNLYLLILTPIRVIRSVPLPIHAHRSGIIDPPESDAFQDCGNLT